MLRKFIYILLLIMLTGCSGTLPEPGMPENTQKEPVKQQITEAPYMNPTVATLLGIGAISMTISMATLTIDDGEKDSGALMYATIFGGAGLIFWGAAGIVAIADDNNSKQKKDKNNEK